MSDFFGTLEAELRAAAARRPRRTVPVPAIAVAGVLALALAPIVLVLGSGGSDSSKRRAGEEAQQAPPRDVSISGFPDAKVVATGTANR